MGKGYEEKAQRRSYQGFHITSAVRQLVALGWGHVRPITAGSETAARPPGRALCNATQMSINLPAHHICQTCNSARSQRPFSR